MERDETNEMGLGVIAGICVGTVRLRWRREAKDTDGASANNAREREHSRGGKRAKEEAAPASSDTKVVKYLDQEYTLPAKTERIVITGAVEAMEDAIVLEVNPVGAISFSGKFRRCLNRLRRTPSRLARKWSRISKRSCL